MFLFAWREALVRALRARKRSARPRWGWRPQIEALEDRVVPSFTTVTGHPITATEGAAFSGAVASFTTDTPAGNLTASIDWGDSQTTTGTISYATTATPLALTGFNQDVVYEAGTASPKVSRDFDSAGFAWFQSGATDTGGTAHSNGLPSSFTSSLGTQFQFQDFTGNNVLLLDNSGGPTSGTLTVTAPAFYTKLAILAASSTTNPNATGTVTVTYTDNTTAAFTYNAPDWITTGGSGAALPNAVARAHVGAANAFTGTDTAFGNIWQMFETDITVDPSKQVAKLIFGDAGPFTTGIFAVTGVFAGFSVSGTHGYADEGSFPVKVTLNDPTPGTASAVVNLTATVAEGDFGELDPMTFTATEGLSFSGAVASFTDPGNPLQTAGDWTATIDWGDGTATTPGTVTGATGGPFTINGTHTYAEDGQYTVIATFSDDPPSTLTDIQIISTAVVQENDFGITAGAAISLTEGQTFSGTLATFQDPGSPDTASDFVATIDWGDGVTESSDTSNHITIAGSGGNYTVSGTHKYTDEVAGSYTVRVSEDGVTAGSAGSAVTVLEADTLSGSGLTVSATEHSAFSGALATFADAGYPGNTPDDFTATIDWGDGVTDTGASVTVTGGNGTFTVSGTHTYGDEGTFHPVVTLSDDSPGTATATTTATANVADAPLSAVTVTANAATTVFNTAKHTITLSATVTPTKSGVRAVDEGTVTFKVFNQAGTKQIGTAVTSGTVVAGSASASFVVPAGTPAGTYQIRATFNPVKVDPEFVAGSSVSGVLTIARADTTTAATVQVIPYAAGVEIVRLTGLVTSAAGPVNGGNFVFSVSVTIQLPHNIEATLTLLAASGPVVNGRATALLALPPRARLGKYTITTSYSGSANFNPSKNTAGLLTITDNYFVHGKGF